MEKIVPCQTATQRDTTVSIQMQTWTSEVSLLEAADIEKSLSSTMRNRLRDLNSSIDSYALALQDKTEVPDQPWITRALKAA